MFLATALSALQCIVARIDDWCTHWVARAFAAVASAQAIDAQLGVRRPLKVQRLAKPRDAKGVHVDAIARVLQAFAALELVPNPLLDGIWGEVRP